MVYKYIERIESANNEIELEKAKILLDVERSRNASIFQFLTLTVPIVSASIAIFASIWISIQNRSSEEALSDEQIIAEDNRAEKTRIHSLDLIVRQSINTYVSGGYSGDNGKKIICLYWGGGQAGKETLDLIGKIVAQESLCGTDGGGFESLVVTGHDDPDRELKEKCIAAPWVEDTAIARDKSGFHARPHGRDNLLIAAPDGHFLGKYEITSQNYRNISGDTVDYQLSQNVVRKEFDGVILPVNYNAVIACTNDKGTGRTCESRATVRAKSFPAVCSKFFL